MNINRKEFLKFITNDSDILIKFGKLNIILEITKFKCLGNKDIDLLN